MTDETPARAADLAQTSVIYRRLRSTEPLRPQQSAPDLSHNNQRVDPTHAMPPATAKVASPMTPPPGGPKFLRRMLTRRIDLREALLLGVTVMVVIAAYRQT